MRLSVQSQVPARMILNANDYAGIFLLYYSGERLLLNKFSESNSQQLETDSFISENQSDQIDEATCRSRLSQPRSVETRIFNQEVPPAMAHPINHSSLIRSNHHRRMPPGPNPLNAPGLIHPVNRNRNCPFYPSPYNTRVSSQHNLVGAGFVSQGTKYCLL